MNVLIRKYTPKIQKSIPRDSWNFVGIWQNESNRADQSAHGKPTKRCMKMKSAGKLKKRGVAL